jgi:hypothetical protein
MSIRYGCCHLRSVLSIVSDYVFSALWILRSSSHHVGNLSYFCSPLTHFKVSTFPNY